MTWMVTLVAASAMLAPLGSAQWTAPANDDFAAAVPLGLPGSASQSTLGSSLEEGEPVGGCNPIASTVWFTVVAPADGLLNVDTGGSSFDTMAAAYHGTDLASLALLGCDDDSGPGLTSNVSARVRAGDVVAVQVGGYEGDSGSLQVHTWLCVPPPANDDMAGAVVVPDMLMPGAPFTASETTQCSSLEIAEPQPCGTFSSTVWFRFTPSVPGVFTIDTSGSDYDTVVAAYLEGDTLTSIGCNDDHGSPQSRLSFAAVPTDHVLLQVGGTRAAMGTLHVHIDNLDTLQQDPTGVAPDALGSLLDRVPLQGILGIGY